jgi:hypothetical protein
MSDQQPSQALPLDIPALTEALLAEDEDLRHQVEDAGLDTATLVRLLEAHQHDPDAQGQLEIRQRLDRARQELEHIREYEEHIAARPRWLRILEVLVGIAWLATPVVGAFVVIGDLDWRVVPGCVAAAVVLSGIYGVLRGRLLRLVESARQARFHEQDQIAAVREELEQDRVEHWLRPRIRDEVGRRAGWTLRTAMEPIEYQGLGADQLDHTIPTDARRDLELFLQHRSAGSVGLSGPRGAGKSSLIRVSCPEGDVRSEGLFGIVVTAPVEFEAREFVLHLFGRLCGAVLGREGVEEARSAQSMPERVLRQPRAVLLVALVLFVAANAILLVSEDVVADHVVWAGALLALAVGLPFLARYLWQPRLYRDRPGSAFSSDLRRTARDRLRNIWFQQSFTTGWSGAVSLPIGVEGGIEGSQELSRLQLSLPDVVSEIQYLVSAIVDEGRRVRIGIDELDKLADTDKARQFLNEMKVLFGISSCFWVVSISEDAMSSFERRGLPIRDEFDSSFTTVIQVSEQTADGTLELLRRRLVGMPQPFMLLCHALAGGLPRDVLRVAWEIVTSARQTGTVALGDVAGALVARHGAAKIKATLVATQRLPPTESVHELQAWLLAMRETPATAHDLLAVCERAQHELTSVLGDVDASTTALELLTYFFFAATFLELFAAEDMPETLTPDAWEQMRAASEGLAAAQQAFGVHPEAAWLATRAVRDELDLDTDVAYPKRPPRPRARASAPSGP